MVFIDHFDFVNIQSLFRKCNDDSIFISWPHMICDKHFMIFDDICVIHPDISFDNFNNLWIHHRFSQKNPTKKIPSAQLRCASKPGGSSKSLPIMKGIWVPPSSKSLPSKHQLVKVQIWIKLSRVANHNLHMRNGQPQKAGRPNQSTWQNSVEVAEWIGLPNPGKKTWRNWGYLKIKATHEWAEGIWGVLGLKHRSLPLDCMLYLGNLDLTWAVKNPVLNQRSYPGFNWCLKRRQGHFPLHSIWGTTKGSLVSPERRWMAQACCLPTFRLCSKMKGPPNSIGRAIPETPTK